MSNSYIFQGMENKKSIIYGGVPIILSLFIIPAILLGYANELANQPNANQLVNRPDVFVIVFILILSFFVLIICLRILSFFGKEKWNIQFDSDKIIIGSNKREAINYPLSALNKVELKKHKPRYGVMYSICFYFDSIKQVMWINIPKTVYFDIASEEDITVFLKFANDFYDQIILSQFDFYSVQQQKTIGYSINQFELPATYVFIKKNQDQLKDEIKFNK